MLDIFCFICLLKKQTLQVLPAYLNINCSMTDAFFFDLC